MKKLLILLMCLMFAISLVLGGCVNEQPPADDDTEQQTPAGDDLPAGDDSPAGGEDGTEEDNGGTGGGEENGSGSPDIELPPIDI